jgi:WD40 repeat protein
LWNLETGQCETELPGHSELVYFVMFTPDGKRVMTTAMDQTLRIWDAASGRSLASWKLRGDAYVFAISPDGKRVALRVRKGLAAVRMRPRWNSGTRSLASNCSPTEALWNGRP